MSTDSPSLLTLKLPKELGGLEADLRTQFLATEAASREGRISRLERDLHHHLRGHRRGPLAGGGLGRGGGQRHRRERPGPRSPARSHCREGLRLPLMVWC